MPERIGRLLGLTVVVLGLATGVARAQDYVSGGALQTTSWTQLTAWFNTPTYPPEGGTTVRTTSAGYSQSADSGASPGSWITLPRNPGIGGFLSEARFGVLIHDTGPISSNTEDGADIAFEFLFNSPDFLDFIFSPRPHIGASIHTEGDVNQGYFGLSWTADVFEDFFVEFTLGGVLHDGEVDHADDSINDLGCSLLFRESISAGVLLGDHHNLGLTFNHISNAGFCPDNDGQDNFGVFYGYRF